MIGFNHRPVSEVNLRHHTGKLGNMFNSFLKRVHGTKKCTTKNFMKAHLTSSHTLITLIRLRVERERDGQGTYEVEHAVT